MNIHEEQHIWAEKNKGGEIKIIWAGLRGEQKTMLIEG